MAIHHHHEEAPWYASFWMLLLVLLIAALGTIWYTLHSRQQSLEMQARRPDSTMIRPGSG